MNNKRKMKKIKIKWRNMLRKHTKKKKNPTMNNLVSSVRCQWFTPTNPLTWEAEIRRTKVQGQPRESSL
jgi:hypothetical protein